MLAVALIAMALAALALGPRPGLAEWPGQNGKISFLTAQNNSGGGVDVAIGTMDPDGSHRKLAYIFPENLSGYPYSWSADGTKLAIIDSMNNIVALTFTPDGSFITHTIGKGAYPTWVIDNEHLIASVNSDLVILDSQGKITEKLTDTPGINETDAALSPDLSTIVFTSNEDPNENPSLPPVAGTQANLWEMNSNGTNRHLLFKSSNADNVAFHPDWKPDSSSIVFSDHGELWTIAPTGANPTQLTSDVLTESDPTWSPDGTLIAYHQASSVGRSDAIWTFDPVTKARNRVTPDPSSQSDFAPSWQPIGNITAPNYYVWGANTCGPRPALTDVLATLKKAAGISTPALPKCPPMGQPGLTSGGIEGHWGDVDCSGAIDTKDAVLLLQYIQQIGPYREGNAFVPVNCALTGTYLQWIAKG